MSIVSSQIVEEQPLAAAPAASRAERLALRVMQFGAIVLVLVVTSLHEFELDRFFVPKELALHVTALAAGLLALASMLRLRMDRVDWLLLAYLFLGALSATLAINPWLAIRALAISASAMIIFWPGADFVRPAWSIRFSALWPLP